MRAGLKFDEIFKAIFYPYTHTLQQSCFVLIFINGVQVKGADRKYKPQKIQLFIKSVKSPTPPTHSLDRLGGGEQESRDWLPLKNSEQEKQHFNLFVDLFSMCSCAVGWVWTGASTLHLAYNRSDVWFTRGLLTAVVCDHRRASYWKSIFLNKPDSFVFTQRTAARSSTPGWGIYNRVPPSEARGETKP